MIQHIKDFVNTINLRLNMTYKATAPNGKKLYSRDYLISYMRPVAELGFS